MAEEVEDLTEVVEVEAVGLEVAEDLDGAAAEVVLIGNKITVHQNMLSVSPRTCSKKNAILEGKIIKYPLLAAHSHALYLVVQTNLNSMAPSAVCARHCSFSILMLMSGFDAPYRFKYVSQ